MLSLARYNMNRHIFRVNANLHILRISLQRNQKATVRSHGCSGYIVVDFLIMEQQSSSNIKILMKSYIEFESTIKP